jgi:hypothetical protein
MTKADLKDWMHLFPQLQHTGAMVSAAKEVEKITGYSIHYESMSQAAVDFWYEWLQGAILVYGPVTMPKRKPRPLQRDYYWNKM